MAVDTPQLLEHKQPYPETLPHVPKKMAELLSSYAGIPEDQQITHITKFRDAAFAKFPYHCVGSFRFVDLDFARHVSYQKHVLEPLSRPTVPGEPEPLFLDCACCLGQDLRKLIADGALPHRLWASDIEPRFIELSFELFQDAHKLPRDQFLCPGNVLADTEDLALDRLNVLNDRVTILHVEAVFHLFDLDDHRRVANRCLRLLRKDTGKPVLILGEHAGSRVPGRFRKSRDPKGKCSYIHNAESWEALWREVCAQPRWKDQVAALEVKTRMFKRVPAEAPDADELNVLQEPGPEDEKLWQMFEVWVTFK